MLNLQNVNRMAKPFRCGWSEEDDARAEDGPAEELTRWSVRRRDADDLLTLSD
jgi:hypothetical protein